MRSNIPHLQWVKSSTPNPTPIKLQVSEVNPHYSPRLSVSGVKSPHLQPSNYNSMRWTPPTPPPPPPNYTSLRLSPKLNSLKRFKAFHFSFCTYLTVYQICRRVTEFLVSFWVAVPYPQIYPRVCAPQAMHCLGVVATSMGRTITDIMEAHRDVLQDMIPPKKHLLRYQPANAQIGLMVRGQGYRNDDLPEKSRTFFHHFIWRQMFRSNLWWCFH